MAEDLPIIIGAKNTASLTYSNHKTFLRVGFIYQ